MIYQSLLLIAVIIFLFLGNTGSLQAVEKITGPDDFSTAKLISPNKGIARDKSAENLQGLTEKK